MALNTSRLKSQKTVRGENSKDSFRVQKGKNFIRVFKFPHTVTERDFQLKLYRKTDAESPKVGDKVEELAREFWVHLAKGIAPTNCFLDKKLCEKCEEAREMSNAGEGTAAKQMKAQKRYAMNIVDMNNPKDGFKRLDCNPSTYEQILDEYFAKLEDGAKEDEIFGANGRDFIIDYRPEEEPSNKYTVTLRDKDRCDALPLTLQSSVVDYYRCTQVDPQDAPPLQDVAAAQKPAPEAEKPKQEAPKAETKVEPKREPTVPAKKTPMSRLKDEPVASNGRKVGDQVSFSDGTADVNAVIEVVDGTKYKVKDSTGAIWEVDESEILPF